MPFTFGCPACPNLSAPLEHMDDYRKHQATVHPRPTRAPLPKPIVTFTPQHLAQRASW